MDRNVYFDCYYCEYSTGVVKQLEELTQKYGDRLVDWNVSSIQIANGDIRHYLWVAIQNDESEIKESIKIS